MNRDKKGRFVKGHKTLVTHGMRKSRAYNTWNHMMYRCYNKNDKRYKHYGGRGIIVVDKWHNFTGFWEDMENGYKEHLSLDRIDNDGNYCKENCRWTNHKEQMRNRQNAIKITYQGQTLPLKEVCEKLDLKYHTVWQRINRYNWPIEKALSK